MGINPRRINNPVLRDQIEGTPKTPFRFILEREEQAKLAAWLKEEEDLGVLAYDWSATHHKVTTRTGMPDFRIWRQGRALLGEMKLPGSVLNPDQRRMHEAFRRSGTEVQIWQSAEEAQLAIARWRDTF